MPAKTIIFDLDETLIEANAMYLATMRHIAALLSGFLVGLDFEMVVAALADENTRAARAATTFDLGTFPQAMATAYQTLCADHGFTVQPDLADRLRAVAYGVYEEPYTPSHNALDTLRALEPGAQLYLWTKGDRAVQLRKAERSGVMRFMSGCIVTDKKTPETLEAALQTWDLDPADPGLWVIGDSPRDDIAPAAALGIKTIWVRRAEPWAYHAQDGVTATLTVDNLMEIERLVGTAPVG